MPVKNAMTPPDALGSYRLSAISGLMAGVAAASSTAGHIFSFRNSDSSTLIVPQYISVKLRVVSGFTAAQEYGFDVVVARTYTASHTGATAITTGSNAFKKATGGAASILGSARIADTGALTAGTHTLDAQPVLLESASELAAAATVQHTRCEGLWDCSSVESPLVLAQNEGLVVRNSVSMGAGGTVRLIVDIGWYEIAKTSAVY